MRRFVFPLLGLALVVAIEVAANPTIPHFAEAVDLFLVWTALVALGGNSLVGLVAGAVAGLIQDSLAGTPFGLYGFANTLVGYGVARLAQRLVVQRFVSVVLVIAGISLAQQLLVALVSLLVLPTPQIATPGWLAGQAIGCGLVGGAMFYLMDAWRGVAAKRRRRRTRRLKLQ